MDAFDASSLLSMLSTLIQHNKSYSRVRHFQLYDIATEPSQELLVHATTILRSVPTRCRESAPSLSRMLQVTSTLYRKADKGSGGLILNQAASAFVDSLSELLTSRGKPIPSSLPAMIEVRLVQLPSVQSRIVTPSTGGCSKYLRLLYSSREIP